MKRKKILIASLVTLVICGGWYGYSEFNRKVKDLDKVRSDVKLQTTALVSAFENDETNANTLYLDKVIEVTGTVRTIEKDEKDQYTIVLGEEGTMSSVRCSMDPDQNEDVTRLAPGVKIIIKGACTGFNADELLGSDVILNRAVIKD